MSSKMDDLINDFSEVRECDYKGEHYSVRDNGAIMRHPRKDKKPRLDDNVWTFGKRDWRTAYMMLGGHRVHIIVAIAFHGEHDSKVYVVDHIDTNRSNNRVENLRWFTRLENALNNPITRKKIESLCGGDIQKFIDDPSCLRTDGPYTQDVSWMRTVTSEEAKAALANLEHWAQIAPPKSNANIQSSDKEWMFKKQAWSQYRRPDSSPEVENMFEKMKSMLGEDHEIKREPIVEFLLKPEEFGDDLEAYFAKIVPGVPFAKTRWGYSNVIQAIMANDKSSIGVAVTMPSEIKPFGAYEIYCEDGKIEHAFLGTCFDKNGALQRMTEAAGEKWTGPDSIDNYC